MSEGVRQGGDYRVVSEGWEGGIISVGRVTLKGWRAAQRSWEGAAEELEGWRRVVIIIINNNKKGGGERVALRESDIHPISPKTPASQYQPIDKKKRKGKRVEDYSRDRAA